MPNTAVKAANAESTWGEAPWEDRKPLIQQRSTSITKCFFFYTKNINVRINFLFCGMDNIYEKISQGNL